MVSRFFAELKRRNVFRAAAFYAASVWLLVQVATQVFPLFHVSDSVLRAIVVAAVIGFPFAMLFAWFYEWTPRGFQRESDIPPNGASARGTGRKLNRAIIAVLALAVILLLIDRLFPHKWREAPSGAPAKSIAVLPFDNLSRDPENAYFADGIQDEILSAIAKIGDLKVISRSSTAKYKTRPDNLRQVGSELSVATLLEGSVQRSQDRVRVIVQLIDARSDHHLWSETYDRELKDIFAVQSEIAQSVAHSLRAKLSPGEAHSLGELPTQNAEAYEAYLKAGYFQREATSRNGDPATLLPQALGLYAEAVSKDPSFARAWAQISYVHSWMRWFNVDDSPQQVQLADEAAQRAFSISPESGETQLALGYAAYWGRRDYAAAMKNFQAARNVLPNDAKVAVAIASIHRRRGEWDAAIAEFNRAVSLDPRDPLVLSACGYTLGRCRRYAEAFAMFERSLIVQPDHWDALAGSAMFTLASGGEIAKANAFMGRIPTDVDPQGQVRYGRWKVALLSHDFAHSLALLDNAPDWIRSNPAHWPMSTALLRGIALEAAGRGEEARSEFDRALPLLEEALVTEPREPGVCLGLAYTYAATGRADDAIRMGQRGAELLPLSADAFEGQLPLVQLAAVYARLGRADDAVPILQRLLEIPAADFVSPALLRLDPVWDPIRSDPRFQKLCTEEDAK